jgi:tetratricopeptide (TPR) repeat protein
MSKHTKPGSNSSSLTEQILELASVFNSTRQQAQKWIAWHQLKQTDSNGIVTISAYTIEALQTLETAYQTSENDLDLLHHLAIAQHAYAWDLELAGETHKASEAWSKALFYWRKLHASDRFWNRFYTKGEQLKNFTTNFDIEAVKEFRLNLVHYLLEIHADFISHYYALGERNQAIRHVELIRKAPLSPKDRKKLEPLIFNSLIASKSTMLADGKYQAVLDLLDNCLSLIPAFPPALIEYLKTARRYFDPMSPSKPLTHMENLDQRVKLRWEELSQSEQLAQFPLGKSTLADLASTCGNKWFTRASFLRRERVEGNIGSISIQSEEYLAYGKAIEWLEKLMVIDPHNPDAADLVYYARIGRYKYVFALQTYPPELLKTMEQDLEQAYHIKPSDGLGATLENVRQAIRDQYYTD